MPFLQQEKDRRVLQRGQTDRLLRRDKILGIRYLILYNPTYFFLIVYIPIL